MDTTPGEGSIPHISRTKTEPRQNALYNAKVTSVHQVNPTVRTVELEVLGQSIDNNIVDDNDNITNNPFTYKPGQWLDVYCPDVPQAGGFTITSSPYTYTTTIPPSSPTKLELAIQESPSNPPAAWFWQAEADVVGAVVKIRVGGSFVWPPPPPTPSSQVTTVDETAPTNVVFIAGGVGINPLISMFTAIHDLATLASKPTTNTSPSQSQSQIPKTITFLYSTSTPPTSQILFLPRLLRISKAMRALGHTVNIHVYRTSGAEALDTPRKPLKAAFTLYNRRIGKEDLRRVVLGIGDGVEAEAEADAGVERRMKETVVYVCGPAGMTDEFVEIVSGIEGMERERVFCEKWW